MAAVKRAIRRLVRLPDGTIGIRYYDLGTGQEVLDLTGYTVLDASQAQAETQTQTENDNSDGRKVAINPSSGGSSQSETRGERPVGYQTLSKNPAIDKYLKQYTPNKIPKQQPVEDENIGGVTVTPDKEIADAEWAGVPEPSKNTPNPGEQIDSKTGNVTVTNPNNPNQTAVFTGLDPDKFNPGLQEAVEKSVGIVGKNNTEIGYKPGLGEDLVDRPSLAPGSSGLYADSMKNLGTPISTTGIYTKAQQNIENGLTPNFARPEGVASGLPARQSVAQNVISNAVRPEGTASGMPAAKPSPVSGASRSVAGKVSPDAPAGIADFSSKPGGVRPEGVASGMPGAPNPSGIANRDAINAGIKGLTNQNDSFGTTPYADAYASRVSNVNPERFSGTLNQQVASAIKDVSRVETADMASNVPTGGSFPAARPEGVASGMPGANNNQTTVASRPETPSSTGFPAAKPSGLGTTVVGRPETPASTGLPAASKTTQPSGIGQNKGLGDVFGIGSPNDVSTAKNVISDAKSVTKSNTGVPQGAMKAYDNPNMSKTTSYENPGGYSQTDVTGSRGWRNNNPGNLVASTWTQDQPGYIGNDSRFAVFDNVQNGLKAQATLLGTPNYQKLTISQAVERYAPAFENNTTMYTNAITDALGVPANTPMSSLTDAQRQTMLSTMHEVEGSLVPGKTGVSLTQKGIDARDNYTGIGTGADTPSERNAANRPSPGTSTGRASGTFGTTSSPGYGRSSISTGGERSSSPGSVGGSSGNASGYGSKSSSSGARSSTSGIGSDHAASASSGKSNPGTSGNMGSGGGTTSGKGPGIGSA